MKESPVAEKMLIRDPIPETRHVQVRTGVGWEYAERSRAYLDYNYSRIEDSTGVFRVHRFHLGVDQMVADKMENMQIMADFAADRLIAFHATLTAEQREKMAEHIEEKSANRCRFFRH